MNKKILSTLMGITMTCINMNINNTQALTIVEPGFVVQQHYTHKEVSTNVNPGPFLTRHIDVKIDTNGTVYIYAYENTNEIIGENFSTDILQIKTPKNYNFNNVVNSLYVLNCDLESDPDYAIWTLEYRHSNIDGLYKKEEFILFPKVGVNNTGTKIEVIPCTGKYSYKEITGKPISYDIPLTTIPPRSNIFGDVNNDGLVDAKDASAILTYYAKASTGEVTCSFENYIFN